MTTNYCVSSCRASLNIPRFCKNNKRLLYFFFFFYTGHSCKLGGCIKKKKKKDYSVLVYFTAVSYCNIRPWCFIYRTPHWQKIALHNEYTNAVQEHILKAVFVKRLLAAIFECTVCWQSVGTTTQMCFVWLLMDSIPKSIKRRETEENLSFTFSWNSDRALSLWPCGLK